MPEKKHAKKNNNQGKKNRRKAYTKPSTRKQRAKNRGNVNAGNAGAHGKLSKVLEGLAIETAAERGLAIELAKAMSCPNMYPAFRLQDGYNSMPTTCADPYMVELAPFSATEGATVDALGVPANETFAFAHRDPRRALQLYDHAGAAAGWSYKARLSDGETIFDATAGTDKIYVDHWELTSTFAPHGPKLHCGTVSDGGEQSAHRWTLAAKNQYLTVSGLAASTAVTIRVYVLIGEDVAVYLVADTTTAGGTITKDFADFTLEQDGTTVLPSFFHFCFRSASLGIIDGELIIGDGDAGPVLRQLALADWEDVCDVFQKLRFNALNLMYSNTAPVLSKQGFAAAWQVPGNMDPLHLIGIGFEAIAVKPNAERMVADDGIHIFFKTSAPTDFQFLDVGDPEEDDEGSCYEIYGASDYLAVTLSIPAVAGRSGYWSVFTDVESRQDSVWFGTGRPGHNRATFEMAIELQSGLPQIHCNPFHIKDIFKWIGKHKGQINGTLDLVNQASGFRASPFITPAKGFMDLWFK